MHYAKHDALYRKVQTGQNNLRKKERKKELKKFSTLKKEGDRENVLTLSSPGQGVRESATDRREQRRPPASTATERISSSVC